MISTLKKVKNVGRGAHRAFELLAGATPNDIVWRTGPMRLRYYKPNPEVERAETPVVLITPIINRFRLVDLDEESSVVGYLTEHGVPVYLVDWGDPIRLDNRMGFEDYVLRILPEVVARTGHEQVDVLGYCLGGTISVMFAARHPELVRRLITIVTPVDFEPMELMRKWVDRETFPVERLTEAFGNMPGHLVSQGFDWLRPIVSLKKYPKIWEQFHKDEFVDSYVVLESWNKDGVDVPGAAYRRLIRDLYCDNTLIRGRFHLRERVLDLADITMPTLAIAGSKDHICKPDAARALIDAVSAEKKDYREVPGGHITSIIGGRARKTVYPMILDWLQS